MNSLAQHGQHRIQKHPLVVGLVNNTSSAAMPSVRAQFAALLASARRPSRLMCFTMRTDQQEKHGHLPIDAIGDYGLDAIIVTGMEVTTSDLRDEWIWSRFSWLYEWCEHNSLPVIWSCLAAHAAVLIQDGIERQALRGKLSGVYDCEMVTANSLLNGLPKRWCCPHSRYNGLDGDKLAAAGYNVLSRGEGVGIDIFAHKDRPGSFYFQGHPEYRAETLLNEFLRDLRRFLAGDGQACPAIPEAYLDSEAEKGVFELLQQVRVGQEEMPRASTLQAGFRSHWANTAAQVFSNWLDIVAEHAGRNAIGRCWQTPGRSRVWL